MAFLKFIHYRSIFKDDFKPAIILKISESCIIDIPISFIVKMVNVLNPQMIDLYSLDKQIKSLPIGYSEVYYLNKRYSVIKNEFNSAKSIKIYAKELGGNHFISFNCYFTLKSILLKPCEMPEQEVVHFLEHCKFDRK